jgi:protein tyrosine phosphatase domain-containing protein 1
LEDAIQATINQACQGKHLVVHCYAGLGRTGMFLACLARQALGLQAEESIRWVRSYVPGAIETAAQVQVIQEFQEGYQRC